jgi:hypothetical protein
MARQRYFLSVANLAQARGSDASLAFDGIGPQALAARLQDALRSDALFQRWKATQPDPDDVDPSLGVTDASAEATGTETSRSEIELVTSLPMTIVKQRLNWLIGASWQLRDMKSA